MTRNTLTAAADRPNRCVARAAKLTKSSRAAIVPNVENKPRRPKGRGSLTTITRNGRTIRRYRRTINGKRVFAQMYATDNAAHDEILLVEKLLTRLATPQLAPAPTPETGTEPDPTTVKDAIEKQLAVEKRLVAEGEKKESTVSSYFYMASAQILPALGNKRVAELTQEDLQKFFDNMKVSIGRKRQIYIFMNRALPETPITEIMPPSKRQEKAVGKAKLDAEKELVFTYKNKIITMIRKTIAAERNKLLAEIPEDAVKERHEIIYYYNFMLARWFIRSLGLRQGEVLGLRIKDFEGLDTDKAFVKVSQQYSRHHKQVSGETGLHATTLKTEESERSIAIPVGTLQELIKKVIKKRLKATGNDRNALVFVSPTGKPIRQQADNKEWRWLCSKMGIAPLTGYEPLTSFRPHLLRACCATRMRDQGATDATIMYNFGWTSMAMVNRYDLGAGADRARPDIEKMTENWFTDDI